MGATVPQAWLVFAAAFCPVGIAGLIWAFRLPPQPVRLLLSTASGFTLLLGGSLLGLTAWALSKGAVLQPFLPRDFLPLLITLCALSAFLGTWLVGSPQWWHDRLGHRGDSTNARRTGLVLLVVSAVLFAAFVALIV